MKLEDLNEDQFKILKQYLKWNRIGHIIGFSLLGFFTILLMVAGCSINWQ